MTDARARRVPAAVLRSFLALSGLAASLAPPPAGASPPDREILKAHGIAADPDSLGRFFRGLYADEEEAREAEAQSKRLSSLHPAVRDAAARRLSEMGAVALAALERAAASPDPEVRRTTARLRDQTLRDASCHVLLAALHTVTEEKVRGLVPHLLGLLLLCERLGFAGDLEAAIRASAVPEDIPLLRAVAAEGEAKLRPVALLALGSVLPDGGLDELRALLRGPPDPVRIAAAWALADRGDRAALPVFGELLDSPDPWVRQRAARALRHVAARTFGYTASAAEPDRRDAAAAWRAWIAAEGGGARWTLPLEPPPRLWGLTLVAIYHEDRVLEYDATGRLVWEIKGLPKPWAIQGLRNGNRLIVHDPGKTLVEYDTSGREVWRHERMPGFVGSVQRLDSGNTLVAVTNPDLVLELRPDESIAWQMEMPGRPTDARLLDNGNLLVTLGQPGKVVEVDRAGKELWAITGLATPYSARRLPDGRTLVAEYGTGRVVEFDPRGHPVWEHVGLEQCYAAERLPDGGTLVADRNGVREIERSGHVRWIHRNEDRKGFLRATRY